MSQQSLVCIPVLTKEGTHPGQLVEVYAKPYGSGDDVEHAVAVDAQAIKSDLDRVAAPLRPAGLYNAGCQAANSVRKLGLKPPWLALYQWYYRQASVEQQRLHLVQGQLPKEWCPSLGGSNIEGRSAELGLALALLLSASNARRQCLIATGQLGGQPGGRFKSREVQIEPINSLPEKLRLVARLAEQEQLPSHERNKPLLFLTPARCEVEGKWVDTKTLPEVAELERWGVKVEPCSRLSDAARLIGARRARWLPWDMFLGGLALLLSILIMVWIWPCQILGKGCQRHLKGVISLNVEPYFKDPRVQQILADHRFKIEVLRIDSQDMPPKVSTAPDAPQFFIPAGVLVAQRINEAAKKLNLTATTYNPFYSPLVVASREPVVQVLVANGVAVKSGDRVYDLDLGKLIKLMLQKKHWNELPEHRIYDVNRRVLIATADPRTANSGIMYLALVSQSLNGNEVVTNRETARRLACESADLFKRQGHQEDYVDKVFNDYLSGGMGEVPLALLYEYQLVYYALENKTLPPGAVLLYPKPTLFDKETFIALSKDAEALGDLLSTNPELQKLAVEYGFRGTDSTVFKEMTGQVGFSVKETVDDIMSPPANEIMDEMLKVIDKAMEMRNQKCGLRLQSAVDSNSKDKIIDQFRTKFISKNKECTVLIVSAANQPDKWTLAEFDDAGKFHTVVLDNPDHELAKALKRESRDESRIVELAKCELEAEIPVSP
ncbi:MAG: hypothetical protein U1F76_32275 [Candidatus Competibacteraceae bacterium]